MRNVCNSNQPNFNACWQFQSQLAALYICRSMRWLSVWICTYIFEKTPHLARAFIWCTIHMMCSPPKAILNNCRTWHHRRTFVFYALQEPEAQERTHTYTLICLTLTQHFYVNFDSATCRMCGFGICWKCVCVDSLYGYTLLNSTNKHLHSQHMSEQWDSANTHFRMTEITCWE